VPELRLENSIVDDRYRVDRCLGRGSYAEIFLAYDERNGDQGVIIKALNTTLQGTLDDELERTLIENFQNEAVALDKVRHPNIIRRLGHGSAADLEGVPFHYLVLEYMPGGDLLSLCRKRPFSLEDSLFYFDQVARALATAHAQGVIHRDIKPNNLLLSGDHRVVKIADFGVAKMALDEGAEITRVGTEVYAPPEHHPEGTPGETNERLTPSADIYSLAKTIYAAMTGRAPRQFSRQPISELPFELADVSWREALIQVLAKATATRVADRYQSIEEFWEDFSRLAGDDPEATVVRSRLPVRGEPLEAAAPPNFHGAATIKQKARIVVDLVPEVPASAPPLSESHPVAEVVVEPVAISARPTASHDWLRVVVSSEWLRRAFIVFLVAALIGLVASTYYHFAGRLDYEDASIAGAPSVNLRAEPSRQAEVLAVLPEGTRVRAYDSRDGWRRVRVVEWAGPQPASTTDSGWVDGRFLRSN
jgi:serine/threonine protein kinase